MSQAGLRSFSVEEWEEAARSLANRPKYWGHTRPIFPVMDERRTARFWDSVQIGGKDECWPWKRARPGCYGQFSVAPCFTYVASRIALYLKVGDFSTLLACHSCDNPPCCNPDHLFAGNDLANKLDWMNKYRLGLVLRKGKQKGVN